MKLYWGPHSCAIGPCVARGDRRAIRTEQINVVGGATHAPPFVGMNPKGKVPTLVRDDGTVLDAGSASAGWMNG